MTITIAVQVHDGVVLASDSASTLSLQTDVNQPGQVVNVYNNANKIFNLRKGLTVGGMTFGAGSIGSASIATLSKDLRARFSGDDLKNPDWALDKDTYSIENVANRARQFLFEEHWRTHAGTSGSGGPFGY